MTIFRFRAVCLLSALLCGCADQLPRLKCDIQRSRDGRAEVSPHLFKIAAEDVIANADELRRELALDSGLVGMHGAIARRFSGSDSQIFIVKLNQLRSNVARLKAIELALVNEGDTLLGTKQEWECKTFADSVTSLDPSQSFGQLTEHLEYLSMRYRRHPLTSSVLRGQQ